MTRKEIINEINCLLSELDNGDDAVSYLTQNDVNWLKENIKALEQEPSEDVVSRKAVHDMLENLPVTVENKWFNWLQKACIRLAELPSATPQEPNWIKCSEHLPDFDVDVLATTKEYGDVVKVTRWRTILKDCGWEWVLVDDIEGNAYNSDEIIAWMSLPEPYKAESEE